MAKLPLEEFLDISRLNTKDYVSNLLKTAHSKNITIEDWNTFILQFQELISQNADVYLGFKHVLDALRTLSPLLKRLSEELPQEWSDINKAYEDFGEPGHKLKGGLIYKDFDGNINVTPLSPAYGIRTDEVGAQYAQASVAMYNSAQQLLVKPATEGRHTVCLRQLDEFFGGGSTNNVGERAFSLQKIPPVDMSNPIVGERSPYVFCRDTQNHFAPKYYHEDSRPDTLIERDPYGRALVKAPDLASNVRDDHVVNVDYLNRTLNQSGFPEVYSKGLLFASFGDGTCALYGIGSCNDSHIVIPKVSPAGDRVRVIRPGTFNEVDCPSHVTIPDSVETIESKAFYGGDRLETVTIPNSVTYIGYNVFPENGIRLTIYCEADSQPAGWRREWCNNPSATVKWGVPMDTLSIYTKLEKYLPLSGGEAYFPGNVRCSGRVSCQHPMCVTDAVTLGYLNDGVVADVDILAERLNALADSDDTTLDQLSELVEYIKSNKSLIDAITTSKVSKSGDTMTATLGIQNNNPALKFIDTTDNNIFYVQAYLGKLRLGGYAWRSALAIDQNGNVEVNGDLTIGGSLLTKETWTFTLDDGTVVTKAVYVDANV